MMISSASYSNNTVIPMPNVRNTAGGKNVSPQFAWDGVPAGTKSFVLMMIDHHSIASNWVHWFVVNIPSSVKSIPEGASKTANMPKGSLELVNDFDKTGYDGPQPPQGTGKHNYDTTIYALNIESTGLSGSLSESEFLSKFRNNILAQATLTGYYQR
jgi:Raf kinase inhibitor-like YbhB/YbcL family protein